WACDWCSSENHKSISQSKVCHTLCNPLSKLVIVPSCTNVPEIRNFMNAFKELTLFFGYSAKRKDKLKTFLTKDMSDLLAEEEYKHELYNTTCKSDSLCQHCRTHVGYHVLTQLAR
ncbi:hypothetical protein MAR_010921, partial [Mya arenaria]